MNFYNDFLARLQHTQDLAITIADLLERVDADDKTGQSKLHLAEQLSLAAALHEFYRETGANISIPFRELSDRICSTLMCKAAELERSEYEIKLERRERYDR